jgi:acetyltransferase, GNAT family protein
MQLQKANIADIEDVMLVFSQARRAQREAGFIQWEDGYPSIETMNTDINSGIGYIIEDNGVLVGYVAIATHDEEYEKQSQLWSCHGTYAVFHRIAISDKYRGKGHSKAPFDLAEAKSRQMNVDISFHKLHSLAIQRS